MQKFGSHLENLWVFLWFVALLMKLITRLRDRQLAMSDQVVRLENPEE